MNHRCLFIAASAAVLAIASTTGWAQEIGRVEVQGRSLAPSTRHDVHATCAHIDAALQDDLPAFVLRSGYNGNVRVSFRLQGRTLSDVRARGAASLELRNAVRHAVARLSCTNGGDAQDYAFILNLQEDESATSGEPTRSFAVLDR